jgi:glutamate racemase
MRLDMTLLKNGTTQKGPIGVFDSGYGGLTILSSLVTHLPGYDYVYLGDNARAPYGPRSFETVYAYTREAVRWFFDQGCPLVILACNTASAKALRNIQQCDLPVWAPDSRVLGVIRPTAEVIGKYTRSGHVGILATDGTVRSASYLMEIRKFFPDINVWQQACPLWVPLIETGEYLDPAADPFIEKYLDALMRQCPAIDTILLACTHYPLLADRLQRFLPDHVRIIDQGDIVADSLRSYLKRHPSMQLRISCGEDDNARIQFCTTDRADIFDREAARFFGEEIHSRHIRLSGESGW